MKEFKSLEAKSLAWDALLIAIAYLPVLINFENGFGENIDSYLVLERGLTWAQSGYVPSRSWGNPLYELMAYPLIDWGGANAGKLLSSFALIGTLFCLLKILDLLELRGSRRVAAFLGIAWLPTVIISGNSILETSFGALFAVAATWAWTHFQVHHRNTALYWAYIMAAGAVATRPGYAILPVGMSLALAFAPCVDLKTRWRFAIWGPLVSLGLGAIPYFALYAQLPEGHFVGLHVFNTGDPLWMRLVKTGIGILALIGVPGWFFIGIQTLRKNWTAPRTAPHRTWLRFVAIASAFYFVRMFLLPDELEYIHFWSLLFLIAVFRSIQSVPLTVALAIALAFPNFAKVHLFDRAENGSFVLTPGVSPGVFEQERQKRLLAEYIRTQLPEETKEQMTHLGCKRPIAPADIFIEKFPIETERHCVLTSVKWYVRMRDFILPSQGLSMSQFLKKYPKKVVLHPLRRARGWRRLQKFYTAFPVKNPKLSVLSADTNLELSNVYE